MAPAAQILGISAAARLINDDVECAARSDAKVLITGESGVGKEVVARLIHQQSARRAAPLVTINCAGIPDTLLASELFGHMRGSFTDAYRDKQGWIEQAHRGTIFMDEIGEMSAQMQSMLLRFLENGEIQRVGSDRRTCTVDVRIIAATNHDLTARVAARQFREDLFYRLNVIHVEIPPLRRRRDDIPVMLDHFLRMFAESHRVKVPQITEDAAAQISAAEWPGNVRQLRNIAERLVVRGAAGPITVADLPREILSMHGAGETPSQTATRSDLLFRRMVQEGATFWTVVHEPFMARDLTRDDLRGAVRAGLKLSHGSYQGLAELFNVAPSDFKRMMSFLRKFECRLPAHEGRPSPARVTDTGRSIDRRAHAGRAIHP
jgi:DNA-binding NtrC family response regulator